MDEQNLVRHVKRFLELQAEQKEKQAALDAVKSQLKSVSMYVADLMQAEDVQSINVDGFTVYRTTKRYVNKVAAVHSTVVVDALREAGMEDFVIETYIPAQIRSYVNDLIEGADDLTEGPASVLPEALQGVFNVYEEHTVASRKSQ